MKRIVKWTMVLWLGAFCAQGAIVVDTQTHSSYNPETRTFATFDVEVGDVVVLVGSGNNTQVQDSLTTSNITWTATDEAVGGGARTLLYYAVITANGTVELGVDSGLAGHIVYGAYHLSSDAGGSILFLDSTTAALTAGTDLTMALDFGGSTESGVYFEALACYNVWATYPSPTDENRSDKFMVAHGSFSEVTGLSHTYTATDDGSNNRSLVGLAFREDSWTGGNRAPAFNSNPVVATPTVTNGTYSDSLANYASDADGDPMTFWKTTAPAWLHVETNGVLSGTAPATAGLNSWTVFVADNNGATNSAVLQINVLPGPPPPQTSATNIILIVIDDLGWMDLSIQGSEFYETPRIDELAANGMRFTQGYAAHPRCLPSRYGLMTGRFPGANGVPGGWPENNLRPSETTVAEALQADGYETAFMGKWHLVGTHGEDNLPQNQGFDINISGGKPGAPATYFHPYATDGTPTTNYELDPGGELYFDNITPAGGMVTDRITGSSYLRTADRGLPGEYVTDRLTDEALDWIDWNADKPMFLCLWHYGVHTPYEAPSALVAKYQAKLSTMDYGDLPEYISSGVGQQKMRQDHPIYAAMIESVDANIGRLMDKVSELGISSNTVFIFTSDNGGLSNRGGYNNRELATSNLPLRTGKGWLYEGGMREAFIVKGPGVSAMVNSNAVVTGTDIYPTCLELAGIPLQPSNHHDGVSFMSALSGAAYERGEPIFWHSPAARPYSTGDFNSSAVRDGDYKLIWWYDTPGKNYELYNVRTDPGENIDLSETMPAKAAELLGKIQAWHAGAHDGSGVVFKSDVNDVSKPPQAWLDDPTVPVGMEFSGGNVNLSWADWIGYDYNVWIKTNLLDASWTSHLTGTTVTNTLIPASDRAFYKVELVLHPEI